MINSVQSLGVSPCHCARVPPTRLGLQWQDLQLRGTRVKAERQVPVIEKSFCKHFTLEPARILATFWFRGHCYNREPTQCVSLASIWQLSCTMGSTRSSVSVQIIGSLVVASPLPNVPSATFRDVTSCWWRNKSACSPNKSQQQLEAWKQMQWDVQTCKEQKQLKISSFSIFRVTRESFWSFITWSRVDEPLASHRVSRLDLGSWSSDLSFNFATARPRGQAVWATRWNVAQRPALSLLKLLDSQKVTSGNVALTYSYAVHMFRSV